ncbi:MAG: nitroreductase/quinone reductase family protein [Chloroflexota bacterium]
MQVEVLDQDYEATAIPLKGEDREGAWARIKKAYPFFAEYEATVSRTIPVVELTRIT